MSGLVPTACAHPSYVVGLPNATYHAERSLSHSLLKHLEPGVAPLQFRHHSWMNPTRPEFAASESMYFGSRMHDFMEDPTTLESLTVVPCKRTKRAGYIGQEQLEAMHVLRKRLMDIPLVARTMATGVPEVSLFAYHTLNRHQQMEYGVEGVHVRCRPDLLSDDVEIHWKFVSRMDPWALGQLIDRLRYVEGLAWYRHVGNLMGLGRRRRVIYFCQNRAPYEIRAVEVSEAMLDHAQGYNEMCVERFCKFYNMFGEGSWADYSHRPQNVHMVGEGGSESLILPPAYERRLNQ